MSLQVWLPLNGTLENKGLSNITVTNNGAVVDNNGKLGKCYKFTRGNIQIPGFSFAEMKPGKKFSVALWCKGVTDGWLLTCGAWEIQMRSTHISVYAGPNGGYYPAKYTATIDNDKWYHIAFTWDGDNLLLKLYIDGIFRAQNTFSTTDFSIAPFYLTWDGPRYVNDFRMYDHCLSAREVKEISKGLVLHYPLDDGYVEPTINLVPNSDTFSGYLPYTNGYTSIENCEIGNKKIVINNKGTWCGAYVSITLPHPGTYTISAYCKPISRSSTSVRQTVYTIGGGISDVAVWTSWDNPGTWQRISMTRTYTTTNITLYLIAYGGTRETDVVSCEYTMPQIEEKDHVTPYTPSSRTGELVYDDSGYNNDGTIYGYLSANPSSAKYNKSITFDGYDTAVCIGNLNTMVPEGIFTFSCWINVSVFGSKGWGTIFGGPSGFEYQSKRGSSASPLLVAYSWGQNSEGGQTYELNKWNMVTIVRTYSDAKFYLNGELYYTGSAATIPSGNYFLGSWRDYYSQNYKGSMSDVRIYATALSADDIKELYNTASYIDNSGNYLCYEFNEKMDAKNMLAGVQEALTKKTFVNGLSSYTQSNCQVTLTDEGYRIYRTPNVNPTDDGQTMWGGFVLDNTDNWLELKKGHTYIISFDIKGKSSTATHDICWSNHVGWGGGGLSPNPSNVVCLNPVTNNFNNDKWQHFSYKFTINDNIYKVCTLSYYIYEEGETYLSYRHFKYGWNYYATGSEGTDVYINNIRMFDVTANSYIPLDMNKAGITNVTSVIENNDNCFIDKYGELNANHILEI